MGFFYTKLALLLSFLLQAHLPAADAPATITCTVVIYQTRKSTAEAFLRGPDLDPNQLMASLQKLTQGPAPAATVGNLPTLTIQNGARGLVKGVGSTVELEAKLSPDGQTLNLQLNLEIGERRLNSGNTFTRFGGAAFLGVIDDSNSDYVQLVFIRCNRQ